MGLIPNFEAGCDSSHYGVEAFEMIYNLLYAFVKHRKQEMLDMIPQYFSAVMILFDCFVPVNSEQSKFIDKLFTNRPLNGMEIEDSQASNITRLLVQISQRSGTEDIDAKKAFSKYAPFLLSEFLVIFNHLPTNHVLKMEWKRCCFALLDCCNEFGIPAVLASLTGKLHSLRPVFKQLVSNWENEHKYQGKS